MGGELMKLSLDAIKENHKNGYWDDFENEFKKEVKVLLEKYHYTDMNKDTLLTLINEVYEIDLGWRKGFNA